MSEYDKWGDFSLIHTGHMVHKDWLLFENQSTVKVFCDQNFLTNLRKFSMHVKIHCNKVLSEVFYIRDLKNVVSSGMTLKEFPIYYH